MNTQEAVSVAVAEAATAVAEANFNAEGQPERPLLREFVKPERTSGEEQLRNNLPKRQQNLARNQVGKLAAAKARSQELAVVARRAEARPSAEASSSSPHPHTLGSTPIGSTKRSNGGSPLIGFLSHSVATPFG